MIFNGRTVPYTAVHVQYAKLKTWLIGQPATPSGPITDPAETVGDTDKYLKYDTLKTSMSSEGGAAQNPLLLQEKHHAVLGCIIYNRGLMLAGPTLAYPQDVSHSPVWTKSRMISLEYRRRCKSWIHVVTKTTHPFKLWTC